MEMAQSNALLSNAVSHLQQIRVFIDNAKSALARLLATSSTSEDAIERVVELRAVLQDLQQQERTYVELLEEYSDVQNTNRLLRDRLSDPRRASSGSSSNAWQQGSSPVRNADSRQKKVEELKRANGKQRVGLIGELNSESELATTATNSEVDENANLELKSNSATRTRGPGSAKVQSQPSKLAALSKYEQSLRELRSDIHARLRAAATSAAPAALEPASETESDAGTVTGTATDSLVETDDAASVQSTRQELRDRLALLERKRSEVEVLLSDLRRSEQSSMRDTSAKASSASYAAATSSRLGSSLVDATSTVAQSAMELTRAARARADETLLAGADLLELLDRERQRHVQVPPLELPSRSSRASSDENAPTGSTVLANYNMTQQNLNSLLVDRLDTGSVSSSNGQRPLRKVRENFRELEEVRARLRQQQALLGSLRRMQTELAANPGVYSSPELLALTNEIMADSDVESEHKPAGVTFESDPASSSATSTPAARAPIRMQDSVILSKGRLRALCKKANIQTPTSTPTATATTTDSESVEVEAQLPQRATRFSEAVRTFGIDVDSYDSNAKPKPPFNQPTKPKSNLKPPKHELVTVANPAYQTRTERESKSTEQSEMLRVDREVERELARERMTAYQRAEDDSEDTDAEAVWSERQLSVQAQLTYLREQAALRRPDPDPRVSPEADKSERVIPHKKNVIAESESESEAESGESIDQLVAKRRRVADASSAVRVGVPRYRQTNLKVPNGDLKESSDLKRLTSNVQNTAQLCEALARGQQRITTLLASLSNDAQHKPATPASTPTPPTTNGLTDTDMLGMLVRLQQQLLSQQCELQLMRQQFGAAPTPTTTPTPPPTASRDDAQPRPMSRSTSFSAFDALRERIYSEVVALIAANEHRPQFVIELFDGLQRLKTDTQREHVLQVIHETAFSRLARETALHSKRCAEQRDEATKLGLPASSGPLNAQAKARTADEYEAASRETFNRLYNSALQRRASLSYSESSTTSSQQRFVDQLESTFVPRSNAKPIGANVTVPLVQKYPAARQVVDDDARSTSTTTNTADTYDLPFADDLGGTVIEQRMRSMLRQSASASAEREDADNTSDDDDDDDNSSDSEDSPSDTGGARPLGNTQSASERSSESDEESDGQALERLVNESLRAVDTPRLDAFIKSLISDLIAVLRSRLDEPFSFDLRGAVRLFIVRAAARLTGSRTDADADAFANQLDSALEKCLARYDAQRLRDCCEDVLVDVSELLFNELAFFRVVRNLDRRRGEMVDDEMTLRRGAPSALLRRVIREQLIVDPSGAPHCAPDDDEDDDDEQNEMVARSAPARTLRHLAQLSAHTRSVTDPDSVRAEQRRQLDMSGLSSEHDDIETLSRRLGFFANHSSVSASATASLTPSAAVAERDTETDGSRRMRHSSSSDGSESDTQSESDSAHRIMVDALTGELVERGALDPVRIELAVSETKPYSRVVRSEEDTNSGSEDTDDTDDEADAEYRALGTDQRDEAALARRAKRGAQRNIVTAVGRDVLDDDEQEQLFDISATYAASVGDAAQFDANVSSNGALSSSMVQVGEHERIADSHAVSREFPHSTASRNCNADLAHRELQASERGSDTIRFGRADADADAEAVARDRAMLSRMYDESFSVAESSENELLSAASTENSHPTNGLNAQTTINGVPADLANGNHDRAANTSNTTDSIKQDDKTNEIVKENANEDADADAEAADDDQEDDQQDEAASVDDLNKDAAQEKEVRSQSDLLDNQNHMSDSDLRSPEIENIPLLENEDGVDA